MFPSRIPILYLILAVLIAVSVIPLYFFGTELISINRTRLKTNEKLLQNTVTRSLAEEIAQRHNNLRTILSNLSSAITVSSGGNLSGEHVNSPELRKLLEDFVSSSDILAYATLLNETGKGVSAGRIPVDAFLQRELERAFSASRQGLVYTGEVLRLGSGKDARTVMLESAPIRVNGSFVGMVGTVIDLQFLIKRLDDANQGGLVSYVVDHRGRLVAGASSDFAVGQEMTEMEIVKDFVNGSKRGFASTLEFNTEKNGHKVAMLGTYSPVPELEWAVIAQKSQDDAYQSVYEMQHAAKVLALIVIVLSVAISIFAARRITTPLETLTQSSRAIASGDFSQRVHLNSRTEIGELAATFNIMSADLERFVFDLKQAALENRSLFLSSIQMLAGAVDEKDPYTKGHSDRVTRYSVILAKAMALSEEEVEKIRISAQLHDVGKIGIEDRILKKPGALTPEEFEIMKTHTIKGASILRPVTMLKEMIPGIELHHESLDGRGYPYGLKGDEIALMPRIIMVADAFDAMTTNRPYQAAMDPEYVVRILGSMTNTKFDPRVIAALSSVFESGQLRLHRAGTVSQSQVEQQD